MAYCTPQNVAFYININQVPDINAVISAAAQAIDDYTNNIFDLRELDVIVETNRMGTAQMPYKTLTVNNVKVIPSDILLPETIWDLETTQKRSVIRIYQNAPFNILINGLEPYTYNRFPRLRLKVNGVFGYENIPFQISEANALLAAYYISLAGFGELKDKAAQVIGAPLDVSSITVEGYSVSYRTLDNEILKNSTGVPNIDRFLEPFKNKPRVQVG